MHRLISLLAAIALGLTAAAANAAPANETRLTTDFARICLSARGDAKLAFKTALDAGWTYNTGYGVGARRARKGEVDYLEGFERIEGGAHYSLLILRERNTRPRHRRPVMQCSITADFAADPAPAMAALFGVPSVAKDGSGEIWLLDASGESLTALRGDEGERARRLVADDQAVIIHANFLPGLAQISYEGPSR